MTLTSGTKLGAYEILSPLGSGGMGEVYRARDTRLKRDVALKILPETLAADPERLARFQREAELLATLGHPNIAAIYGLEEADGMRALVLELVDGPTLADLLASASRSPERESLRSSASGSEAGRERGSGAPRGLAFDEALPIARQIAEALEAAHEQGIVHRDLKPANIKLRNDGTVKVLDFGLAKLTDPGEAARAGAVNVTASPTITTPAMMTGVGTILGTAAYMSPEQARGRPVDRRADIWAFGCVLYEMLTGRRAFDGEDVTEVIAAVVKSEPDWGALPASVSGQVRLLLERCLEKDPRERIGEIGTVRFLLSETIPGPPRLVTSTAGAVSKAEPARRRLRRVFGYGIAFLAVIGSTTLATWEWARMRDQGAQPVRFAIVPQTGQQLPTDLPLTISPDGSRIVYRSGPAGQFQLFVRLIGDLEARPLAGTAGARYPFVSPDGRWVGFFADGELKKVPMAAGAPITICRVTENPRGASWVPDDTIVFATANPATGLLAVPAGGGEPRVLTKPDAFIRDEWYPFVLPDGRSVLSTIVPFAQSNSENGDVELLDLKTGQRKVLIRGGSDAMYTDPGYLVFGAAGSLRAVRFDASSRQVLGDPVAVVERVAENLAGSPAFTVSRTGTLVYLPGTAASQAERSLVWVNREGREEPIKAPLRAYTLLRLSPDGTRVALDIRDKQNDIWVWDLARQTLTPLTFNPASDRNPVWTPDGRRIIFASNRDGGIHMYWQAADGTGAVERLTTGATGSNFDLPMTVSTDGTQALLNQSGDLALLGLKRPGVPADRAEDDGKRPLEGAANASTDAASRRTEVLFHTPFTEDNAEISPDGRWLAYQSNQSGTPQIYVRPFPKVDSGRWQVSTDGGVKAAWAPNGRELFYVAPSAAFMTVPVTSGTTAFVAGKPLKLFDAPYCFSATNRTYDVSPDGQRFLMIKDNTPKEASTVEPPSVVVVVNWSEELKQRVPAK